MNKPLRIGIEAQRLFRKKKHGMEVVALELIRHLQQIDKINQYVIFVRADVDDRCVIETQNFTICAFKASSYADWEQCKLPKMVKIFNLDFLHSTCNTSALFLSIPLILTLHDIIYLEKVDFKGSAYQNLGNLYRRLVVPPVARKSQVVITVSNFEKDVIVKRLNLSENKLQVIYNGVNDKFNHFYQYEDIANFKKRYSLPESFILFLGNTAPKKNTYHVIIGFMEYCKSCKVIIPLVILDYERADVLVILEKHGQTNLINYIIFPGFVPSDQMPLMYNASTLFLYPSLRESFGLPILEAMACNTPVITSNTSCMPEIAADAALLVNPHDPMDIAHGIEKIISDQELQITLKRKGLSRIASFSWRTAALQLLTIYNSMETQN
ncbi:Glycosyltransferase involved in cell wall bisynthesis [bacterium A37T11]|nr:Glycosyltransferase involved in cell wall bisynthesis [bacterium A37T11]